MSLSIFEQKILDQFNKEQKEKISELRELINKINKEIGVADAYDKIFFPFSKRLIKENPDIENCYLYHVLIGSSINLSDCSSFDLEDNSIIEQLKNIYENTKQRDN